MGKAVLKWLSEQIVRHYADTGFKRAFLNDKPSTLIPVAFKPNRQRTIAQTNVDLVLWRHVVSQGHNGLTLAN